MANERLSETAMADVTPVTESSGFSLSTLFAYTVMCAKAATDTEHLGKETRKHAWKHLRFVDEEGFLGPQWRVSSMERVSSSAQRLRWSLKVKMYARGTKQPCSRRTW